jgi:hypothetical protein
MVDVLQFAKDFGLPLGLLISAVIVLWRENARLRAKVEELYERWAKTKRGEDEPEAMLRIEGFIEEAKATLEELRETRTSTDETKLEARG